MRSVEEAAEIGAPARLLRFDPSEWPSSADPVRKPGTAYGEALTAFEAAWDAFQAARPGVGRAERERATQEAWKAFPDDYFDYSEL